MAHTVCLTKKKQHQQANKEAGKSYDKLKVLCVRERAETS